MPPTAPAEHNILELLAPFQTCFSRPTWKRLKVLIQGAIVATGARTVTACLRATGRSDDGNWSSFHRVLSHAPWRDLDGSRLLATLLVKTFNPARLIFTLDETIERRTGRKIAVAGYFRDPIRSTDKKKVTCRGIRWLVLALVVRPSWSDRAWSLPVLSIALPAEPERQKLGSKKKGTDFSRQLIFLLRRWFPERELFLIGDGGFAVHELYSAAHRAGVTIVTRCRHDIYLFEPLVVPKKRPPGRPWTHGPKLPNLEAIAASPDTKWADAPGARETAVSNGVWHRGSTTLPSIPVRCVIIRDKRAPGEEPAATQAISTTATDLSATDLVALHEERWSIEVTFQESRAHLGVETGRGWSAKTIARTTPSLLALFSIVVLLAHTLHQSNSILIRQSAWYQKTSPTFIDCLAAVRRSLWVGSIYRTGTFRTGVRQINTPLARSLLDSLCYAA